MSTTNPSTTPTAPPAGSPKRERPATVYAKLPYCPGCGGTRLRAYKSGPLDSDGSRVRHCRCADCGTRATMVVEWGES